MFTPKGYPLTNFMIISFLASHGGSSARYIIQSMANGTLTASPGVLVCNNRHASILEWCLENDFPARHISAKTHRGDQEAEEAMCTVLEDAGTELLVCSGYMKILGPKLLGKYPGRILNIHPSLLPRHGGRGMFGDRVHEAVLAAGEKNSGASVHIVCEGVDEGPIVMQQSVAVEEGDTIASLRARVQSEEPELYLRAIKYFLKQQ
jgi:phosphoribosylglycinamide formyltransferase-1